MFETTLLKDSLIKRSLSVDNWLIYKSLLSVTGTDVSFTHPSEVP